MEEEGMEAKERRGHWSVHILWGQLWAPARFAANATPAIKFPNGDGSSFAPTPPLRCYGSPRCGDRLDEQQTL